MADYLPPVVTTLTADIDDVLAKVAIVKAAIKSLGGDASVALNIKTDGLAAAVAKVAALNAATKAATATTGASIPVWHRWLDLIHFGFAALGENLVADTIGIAAFAISAVTNLGPAIEAVNNLGQTYGYLNNNQKAAAESFTQLKDRISGAVNVGVFAVFQQALDLIDQLLGKQSGITEQATQAFEYFAAALRVAFGDPQWAAIFSRSSGLIKTDLTALFNLLIAFIQLIPGLLHDFNGLGLGVLGSLTSLFRFLAWISEANPALTRLIYALYLANRAFKYLWVGMGTGPGPIQRIATGVGALASRVRLASSYMSEGALVAATYGLGISATAVAVGAGVIAAGALAFAIDRVNAATGQFKNPADQIIASLTQMDNATGANVAGYEKLAYQMRDLGNKTYMVLGINKELASRLSETSAVVSGTRVAFQQAGQAAQNQANNLLYLMRTYGLTSMQAYQLAKAVGLTGNAMKTAFTPTQKDQVQAYEQAVNAARNPLTAVQYDMQQASNSALQLDDQVTALTNAFNAMLTPLNNVIQGSVTFSNDLGTLTTDLKASNGQVGLGTAAQKASASAMAQAAQDAMTLATNIKQQTGSTQKAMAPLQQLARMLLTNGAHGAYVAAELRAIRAAEDALHDKTFTITTIWSQQGQPIGGGSPYPGGGGSGGVGHRVGPGAAMGTNNAAPGWMWVGERGPELLRMRGGERVIPNHALPNLAGGGGTAGDTHIHVYLDGKELQGAVVRRAYQDNFRNGSRLSGGRPTGILRPR